VESIIAARNYRRRPPKTNRSSLIELVFHEFDTAWSMEIITAVERRAAADNINVVVSRLETDGRPHSQLIDTILERNPLGVLLVMTGVDDTHTAKFESRSIPVVAIDAFGDQPDRIPTVGANNWAGAFAATKHLVDLGHRRIGMISGPIRYLNSRARVDGYRSALESSGIDIDRSLIRYGDFFFTGGALHARELLTRETRPTAIFAGSDLQAIGVYRTALELGICIPDELSVVGYDGIQLTEWMSPPLTTIDQSLGLMGETATDMLLTLAEGGTVRVPHLDLSTELIVRTSTAPPLSERE
jgi:LacI family transcriptional regulator